MKIVNNTKWKTAHLRAITSKIASAELEPKKRKRITIHFSYAKYSDFVTGKAYWGGNECWVYVPKTNPHDEEYDNWIYDLASTVAHEIAHCHGHRGERWMRSSTRYGAASTRIKQWGGRERAMRTRAYYDWVFKMPLDLKDPPKKKTQLNTLETKLAKATEALKRWKTKKKRADTAIAKYRRQISQHKYRITKIS